MSLLTALLAFVPALAAKREPEPEPELDRDIELFQAREGREHAEDALQHLRHQLNAMAIEIEALRGALRERDRVIDRLASNAAIMPLPPRLEVAEAFRYARPVQQVVYASDGQRATHEQHQRLQAQTLQHGQALMNQQAQANGFSDPQAAWAFCTCVPGRADALRRGSTGEA